MLSNWPSFTSLLCDLHDDDTCTTCHRYFASFEVKIGNPSPTCFTMKQAIGCRRVSSRRLHPLIDFEAQIDKPPPTWFWGTNQETIAVILMPKLPNRQYWFWGPNRKTVTMVLRLNREIHTFRLLHVYDTDRTWRHPTSQSSSHRVPDLCLIIPNLSHQVSYYFIDSRRYPSCRIRHLHTHHETSKHVSPHRITESGLVQPNYVKFNLEQVNYSSHV
jgi:hypothetical protein